MIWTLQPGGNSWISGIYKIQRYERSMQDQLGIHYRAYYKPTGWTNWGNYVDDARPYFVTLKTAQAACANHQKETQTHMEGGR